MTVLFKFKTPKGTTAEYKVPSKYARAKAIELAEDALFDKIFDVTYTVIIDGQEVTKPLDYFNDIL